MIQVPIINQKLNKILDDFKNNLFDQDILNLEFDKFKSGNLDQDDACSLEQLEKVKKQLSTGRTYDTWSVFLGQTKFNDLLLKLNSDLAEWNNQKFYIVPRPGFVSIRQQMFEKNALAAVYPAKGFMGWHNNSDAPGYNVLLTWTANGLGFFRYQDPINKEIVTLQDTPGWSCKLGYFGRMEEQDKLFWHCCSTNELRITVAWIFPTLNAADDFHNTIITK